MTSAVAYRCYRFIGDSTNLGAPVGIGQCFSDIDQCPGAIIQILDLPRRFDLVH
jgi:hypothetical protein